jgi:hypothetical protein
MDTAKQPISPLYLAHLTVDILALLGWLLCRSLFFPPSLLRSSADLNHTNVILDFTRE